MRYPTHGRLALVIAILAVAVPVIAEITAEHIGDDAIIARHISDGALVAGAYGADSIDLDDIADTLALDADLTWTLGAGEQDVYNKAVTDATADEGLQINYTASDTTSGTTGQHALSITNIASTEAADALVECDNADADDNVATCIKISNPTRFTSHFDTTGALLFGSANVTGMSFVTDGTGPAEYTFSADSINLDDLEDTMALDADLTLTAGGGEQVIVNKAATDATADNGLEVNYTALDTTSGTAAQYAVYANNVASTEAADGCFVADNADADDNVGAAFLVLNAARFTSHFNVGNAAAVFGDATVDSWEFKSDGVGTGEVILPLQSIAGAELVNDTVDGAQLADTVTLDATLLGVANGSTGDVTLDFHDYADTADDDMAHVVFRTNCTDTGTGAEDCDFSIGVVEAGAAAETRFSIDADGGVTIGSANTNSLTVTSSATGDASVVLPVESVSAGEITNPVRSFSLPTGAFFNCTASAIIDWGNEADAHPDFVLVNSAGPAIAWDSTGGSPDTSEVCATFTVPADWVSGGTFVFRVTQGAATVTNLESIEARLSIDGAALGAADEDNLANQTAVQSVTSAPTGTQAAGASVSLMFKQGNASGDDTVNVLSVDYQYTASM